MLLRSCSIYEVVAGCCSRHMGGSFFVCLSEIHLADLGVGPKVWGLLSATQVLSFRTLVLGTTEGGKCRGRGGRSSSG